MSNKKSLSDWEEIFDNTEMYDEIKNTYKENFEKQQHRELNDTDEHLMQLGLLFQGWEESNNPQYEDSDTPAKQAWSEFHNKMEQFREEDMEPHFTPEAWSKTAAAFAAIKEIAKEICDEEPKVGIGLTDYDLYKMFGDEDVHLSFTFPKAIKINAKSCGDLVKFEENFKTNIGICGDDIENLVNLNIILKMHGKLIYIKKSNRK